MRRERLKHTTHLGVQPADEGLFLVDFRHEGGHAHDRRLVRAGKPRVPLLRFGDELSGAAALFVHGDHGALFVDARHRRGNDRAALVADPVKADAVPDEIVVREQRTVTAVLLVVGGEQVDVHREFEALEQQLLERGKLRKQRRLGVDRAAPPELSAADDAGEGRFLPAAGRFHDVVVRHEQHVPARVFSRELIQVGVLTEDRALCLFGHEREERPDHAAQLQKFFGLKAFLVGHRLAADHLGKALAVIQVSFVHSSHVVCPNDSFFLARRDRGKHILFPVAQKNEHGQQAKQAPCHRRELQTGHTDVFTGSRAGHDQ